MQRLRQIYFVARLDLANAIRSRRALAALLLYVLASLGATYLFCRAVEGLTPGVDADRMAEALARNRGVRRWVVNMTGDAEVAERLVTTPPLSLFFGWFSLTVLPLLAVVHSSDAVARQVSTGEARFVISRSGRLPFALGTLGNQAFLMTAGLVLGTVVSLLTGSAMLGWGSFTANAIATISIGAGAWCYSFAYLALAVGISQVVSSAGMARGMGLAAAIGLSTGSVFLSWSWVKDRVPETLLAAARWLFPPEHSLGLWRPTLGGRLPAMCTLVLLGAIYLLPCLLYFRRRDL